MHLEQKRLMLQLPTVLLPLLFSSLLLPSSTSAASTYNLPSCYLECGRNLTGSLACDLGSGTDCDCTSSSFLDALGCCIVENCWTSHRSAQFRIPCQDGYVDASCPANVDVENSSTAPATGTATKMSIQALDIVTSTTLSTTTSRSSQASTVQVQTNTDTATGATATADSSNSGSDDKSGVIGLGVGLGLGIPALLLAIFLVAYYYRKTKKAELESERSSRSRTRVGGPKSGRPSSPSTLVGSAAQPTTEKGSSVTHRKNSVNARSARAGRDTALMSELPG